MKIRYNFFERFGRMHEIIFLMFWQKLGILIPDVYLYSIKIQTNIDQNKVKNLQKITDFFEIIFEENFFRAGLDPAGLIGSLAQASDRAGPQAQVN